MSDGALRRCRHSRSACRAIDATCSMSLAEAGSLGARRRYLLVAGRAGFGVEKNSSGVAQQLVNPDFATPVGDVLYVQLQSTYTKVLRY